ncbi:GidB Predicted S-adenosylmethionine-dependent methyltransferase involved in bacterial cell division [Rhabdaerophilaceae bacterium]
MTGFAPGLIEGVARQAIADDPRVSRETLDRLNAYVDALKTWQARINLVSSGTLETVWSRHILDCLQLAFLVEEPKIWADLGSGAGLPGLIIACTFNNQSGHVHLVESNGKKVSFLRHVAGSLQLPVTVHDQRIEVAVATLPRIDIVTARALADLDQLCAWTSLLLKSGTIGLFPKGRDYARELTTAQESWHFSYELHQSLTDPNARIVRVSSFS